ncbi:MAG: NUDIX hydrolase [Candidatus Saccharimonas sp.]
MSQVTLRDAWGNLAVTVSCKAVVFDGNKIWLRKNERDDWELPGGRLDENEQPEETIIREIHEELGVALEDPQLLDVYIWQKEFGTTTHVELVTFVAKAGVQVAGQETTGEAGAAEFKKFTIFEALELENLPEPYKRVLRKL